MIVILTETLNPIIPVEKISQPIINFCSTTCITILNTCIQSNGNNESFIVYGQHIKSNFKLSLVSKYHIITLLISHTNALHFCSESFSISFIIEVESHFSKQTLMKFSTTFDIFF